MNHIASHLREVFFNKKTGRLIYRRGEILKYFFFQNGNLIQVKTNQPDERLGEILFKLERIPKDASVKIDDFIEPNKNLGEVLRSRGVISEKDLNEALTYQLRETVLNVFPHFDAAFEFQEHQGFSGEIDETRVSVPLLIEYGIRRMSFHPLLEAGMAHRTPVLGLKTYAYLLTLEDKEVLEKINGKEPAESILKGLTIPAESYWKSLYLFFCLGIVNLEGEAKVVAADAKSRLRPETVSRTDLPQQVAEMMALRDTLPEMTYYQILDIPKMATEEEVKKAYFQMARRFHPDRFERKVASEFKGQIDEVFDAITNAYRVLSNKDTRRLYDAKSGTPAGQEDAQDSLRKAEIKFRQGKTLYAQGRFDEAIAYLEEAIRTRKDKGDYYLLLAMVESKLPAYVKKAEADFQQAIQLEPWNPEGYFGLGLLYKDAGLQTKAIKNLEKAMEADREHSAAREALAELTGGEKKKGVTIFGMDLFGSKKKKK